MGETLDAQTEPSAAPGQVHSQPRPELEQLAKSESHDDCPLAKVAWSVPAHMGSPT